jgi:CRISPR-associated protein Cas6
MYWQETNANDDKTVPDDVVDLVFAIKCRSIPVDHVFQLSEAICKLLPWFAQEPKAGLHTIHVAESANGWIRPDDPNALLHPSRRTKLTLRVPKHRISEAGELAGETLNIAGHELQMINYTVKKLSDITTIFSRYVVAEELEDEDQFLEHVLSELKVFDVRPKKMLCGIEKHFQSDDGSIKTRSLMLADLTFNESILLQQNGLGGLRHMGCGIFLPHKDINEIPADLG